MPHEAPRPEWATYRIPLDTTGGIAALSLPTPLREPHLDAVRRWLDLLSEIVADEVEAATLTPETT